MTRLVLEISEADPLDISGDGFRKFNGLVALRAASLEDNSAFI